jgi:hypothetical protein
LIACSDGLLSGGEGRGTWKTLQQGNIEFLGNVIDGAIADHLLIVILIFARDW